MKQDNEGGRDPSVPICCFLGLPQALVATSSHNFLLLCTEEAFHDPKHLQQSNVISETCLLDLHPPILLGGMAARARGVIYTTNLLFGSLKEMLGVSVTTL